MAEYSKLQIRAKVLSVISGIKSANAYSEELLKKYVKELSDIDDKNALFDIFIKEFIKLEENEYMFASCIIKSAVSVDYVQEKVFEMLKSSAFNDETKYKLVQLLRVLGSNSANDAIPEYFDNPEEVLDMETQKLLENAVINPEAMLDFLDFVYAVPQNDKKLLLASLTEDFKGDVLANIIYPILYADFDDEFKLSVIDTLSNSKSSLAIEPFMYLSKISENEEIINACKVGLKKLKLAGASIEKADEYFNSVIKNSDVAELYTTIPDGNGNQALFISRVNKEDKFVFEAVVINDRSGVVDCFGFFNITRGEFTKILDKFYKSEGKYRVSSEYVKLKLNQAIETSIKHKRVLPYEFVCWNVLTRDFKPLEFEINELVEKNVIETSIEKDDLLELLTKDYTLRWFISKDESTVLKDVVEEMYNQEDLSAENISSFHKKAMSAVDDVTWKNRLVNLIYLLQTNSSKNDASKFYSVLKNSEHYSLFKSILVQRSIFNHFIALKENQKESALTVNIFKKRNTSQYDYDIKKLDTIINKLKKSWIDG